jgi:hypothetical protein
MNVLNNYLNYINKEYKKGEDARIDIVSEVIIKNYAYRLVYQ